MDRRRDDVRRPLAAQLDDVFAEIGLDHREIRRFERGIEADFFGTIDLPLTMVLAPRALQSVDDDGRGFRGRRGEMHRSAGLGHRFLVGLEIEVEVGERVVLDVARAVAQRLEFGQAARRRRGASA